MKMNNCRIIYKSSKRNSSKIIETPECRSSPAALHMRCTWWSVWSCIFLLHNHINKCKLPIGINNRVRTSWLVRVKLSMLFLVLVLFLVILAASWTHLSSLEIVIHHWHYFLVEPLLYHLVTWRGLNHYRQVSTELVDYPYSVTRNPSHQFTFHLSPKSLLPTEITHQSQDNNDTNPRIWMLIKSRPESLGRRQTIRSTWANTTCYQQRFHVSLMRVFLLAGLAAHDQQTATLQVKLDIEAAQYDDLLQVDNFVDHYYNNTWKVIMGLQWASDHPLSRTAAGHHPVVLVDDDYLVNPLRLSRLVVALSQGIMPNFPESSLSTNRLLQHRAIDRLAMGSVLAVSRPIRYPGNVWFVDRKEYRYDFYPNYVAGGFVLLGGVGLAHDVAALMASLRYQRFDDVLLGLALLKLGVVPVHAGDVFDERVHFLSPPVASLPLGLHAFDLPFLARHCQANDRPSVSKWC